MRNFLIGLGVVVVTSAPVFASENCTYFPVGEDGYRLHLPVYKSVKIVEEVLSKKGFKRVSDESLAKYRVDFHTDISTGRWNELEYGVLGDNVAIAALKRISDGKIIYETGEMGVSGIVGPVAKKQKSRLLLKRILKRFPKCSEINWQLK